MKKKLALQGSFLEFVHTFEYAFQNKFRVGIVDKEKTSIRFREPEARVLDYEECGWCKQTHFCNA